MMWISSGLCYGAIALAILLFLLALRRSGKRVGRLAERLDSREKANEVQRRMLEAAARRPLDRNDLFSGTPEAGTGRFASDVFPPRQLLSLRSQS